MPFNDGENVGAYRIVEKLGQGGMATVFKAYHPALDRYVAIKVLHPAFTADPTFLARFQREARIVAKLDHPNIVPIYDFSEHRGHTYLVMRFIDGETLKARMKRGAVTQQEVVRIAKSVGDALTYAHKQDVLHRDVKPSNVMLTADGGVFLTDFGLARMAAASESTMSRDMMVGTPQYISPEQAKGSRDLSACTDVYSLGVVLYELLVGRVPFTADTPYAIIHDHIFTPLPLPRMLNPGIPETVERVLLRALAKEPKDRFQTVSELTNGLDAALSATPIAPRPTTAPSVATMTPAPAAAVETAEDGRKGKKEKRRKKKAKPPRRRGRPPGPPRRAKVRRKGSPWPWVAAIGALAIVCLLSLICWASVTNQRKVNELVEQAHAAEDEGRNFEAIDLYHSALMVDPGAIEVYLEATELVAKLGQLDRALDLVLDGLQANPKSTQLHMRAAELAAVMEKWDEAEQHVGWLLEEEPDDATVQAYAALLLMAKEQSCDNARSYLQIALDLDPGQPWAIYGQAVCYLEDGDADEAARTLEDLLHQPDLPPILRARAEDMLNNLEGGSWAAIEREFGKLRERAEDIPNPALRNEFLGILDDAQAAWHDGARARARQQLEHAWGWLEENWDGLGAPLNDQLRTILDTMLRLSTPRPGDP